MSSSLKKRRLAGFICPYDHVGLHHPHPNTGRYKYMIGANKSKTHNLASIESIKDAGKDNKKKTNIKIETNIKG